MEFNALIVPLLAGLQLGAIYALIALGLMVVCGALGFVNFAHGAFYVIAIYAGVMIAAHTGFIWAIVLAPLSVFALGAVFERGLMRRFYARSYTDQILVTLGIAIAVEGLMKWRFGAGGILIMAPEWARGLMVFYSDRTAVPPAPIFQDAPSLRIPFIDGFVTYSFWHVLLVTVSLVSVVGLFVLLQFTRFGVIARAGLHDPETVGYRRSNIGRNFAIIAGLSGAIAVVGVLASPLMQVVPDAGVVILVPALLAVVIGGMGSPGGTLIVAMLIGIASSVLIDLSWLSAPLGGAG